MHRVWRGCVERLTPDPVDYPDHDACFGGVCDMVVCAHKVLRCGRWQIALGKQLINSAEHSCPCGLPPHPRVHGTRSSRIVASVLGTHEGMALGASSDRAMRNNLGAALGARKDGFEMVTVVSAAIVNRHEKRILLAQRSGTTSHAWKWCTPGGKVDKGESQYEALVRELREELGIENVVNFKAKNVYSHSMTSTRTGEPVEVFCWRIDHDSIVGTISPKDGTVGIGWFDAMGLYRACLAPADEANLGALIELVR